MKDKALFYLKTGLSVLPAKRESKRPAIGGWKTYQDRLPSQMEVETWFANAHDALCLVCGKVSGNLEVIDFDNHGELFPKWKEFISADLLAKLVIEQTPSGGFHVAYRAASPVCGNIKLAQGKREDKLQTLIETRGEGGLFLCAPSEGYTLLQNDFSEIPTITDEEREDLLSAAYALNEHTPEAQSAPVPVGISGDFAIRPGDDYNARGDFRSLLIAYGWTPLHKAGKNEYFRRPGKTSGGQSASFNGEVFYVFSSNAAPFEPGAYSPFNAYAILAHNGDFSAAANALLEQGFGKPAEQPGVDISGLLSSPAIQPEKPNQQLLTARELIQGYRTMKEPLIDGLLRREEVMNIVAAPKTGKSWLVMQLALALVSGGFWAGRECTKSRVLLVDNELHKETLSHRLYHVAESMGIREDDEVLDDLIILPQRGGEKELSRLQMWLQGYDGPGFDVVIIDALYKALPKDVDENSNGQITSVYNMLDRYAQEMNAAIILVHHTSKGNQANKSVTDVGSGAGAQSRSPDTHLTLRQHSTEGVVSVYCCVRSFPPVAPFCLRRDENNLWTLAPEEDPEALEGKETGPSAQARKRRMTTEDVAETIAANLDDIKFPMGKTRLVETIRDKFKASKAKIEVALELLCEQELLEVRNGDPEKKQQAMKCFYRKEAAK